MKIFLKPNLALMIKILLIAIATIPVTLFSQTINNESRWNKKYDFIYDIPPIIFHYHHGILAGCSDPGKQQNEDEGYIKLPESGSMRLKVILTSHNLHRHLQKSLRMPRLKPSG